MNKGSTKIERKLNRQLRIVVISVRLPYFPISLFPSLTMVNCPFWCLLWGVYYDCWHDPVYMYVPEFYPPCPVSFALSSLCASASPSPFSSFTRRPLYCSHHAHAQHRWTTIGQEPKRGRGERQKHADTDVKVTKYKQNRHVVIVKVLGLE